MPARPKPLALDWTLAPRGVGEKQRTRPKATPAATDSAQSSICSYTRGYKTWTWIIFLPFRCATLCPSFSTVSCLGRLGWSVNDRRLPMEGRFGLRFIMANQNRASRYTQADQSDINRPSKNKKYWQSDGFQEILQCSLTALMWRCEKLCYNFVIVELQCNSLRILCYWQNVY